MQTKKEKTMKFFSWDKDGGPESKVAGLFLCEIKSLFSVALLHFYNGSRDAYHNHAFNALSWLFSGQLKEDTLAGDTAYYRPGLKPIVTPRNRFHRVTSVGDTWVLTFRGPWVDTWKEYLPKLKEFVTLTHGRKPVMYTRPTCD